MKNLMKISLLIPFLCGFMWLTDGVKAATPSKKTVSHKTIAANDANVEYIGRTLEKEGAVQFDWSGVHIRSQFTGGYLAVAMSDTKGNYYDFFLDGKCINTFKVSKDTVIVLASGLPVKPHQFLLFKRTEGEQGTATIKQFIVAKNGTLIKCSGTPVRKVEFIGNSITCGFGTEVSDPKAPFLPSTENSYHSYASIVSRYFDADYHFIAHSGLGVVRNYGDKKTISEQTMRQRFLHTFDMNLNVDWDFSKWKPDVVVVKLGTNDYSNPAICPTEEQFVNGYLELIASIRKAYGEIPIVCVSSCMSGDKLYQSVQAVVAKSNDKNIHFVGLKPELLNWNTDFGACAHPNYEGQKKMALVLIPSLSTIMGWSLSNKPVE